MRACAAAAAALVVTSSVVSALAQLNGPMPGPLPLFPRDNWWNLDISTAPVDASSGSYISFIGATRRLHPDFGGDASPGSVDIYGFPYAVVDGAVPKQTVQFQYFRESDGVDHTTQTSYPFYPIPIEARTQPHWVEGGAPGNVDLRSTSDRHMLIVDRDARVLYELYNLFFDGAHVACRLRGGVRTRPQRSAAGRLDVGGRRRPRDPAGARPLRRGVRRGGDRPRVPRHRARDTTATSIPRRTAPGPTAGALPMGARLRLKATKNLTGFTPEVQRIFRAMQRYGLIVADNGSDMYISGDLRHAVEQ